MTTNWLQYVSLSVGTVIVFFGDGHKGIRITLSPLEAEKLLDALKGVLVDHDNSDHLDATFKNN